MPSLIFPDVNVWMALATAEHVHSTAARQWWENEPGQIGFSRVTQLGLLRLLTTAAAMDGKPLSMDAAWKAYDHFFNDDRVALFPESPEAGRHLRALSAGRTSSPKLWADAWMLALCAAAGATLVTFDRGLAARGARCLI